MNQTARTPGRTQGRRAFGGILIIAALVGLGAIVISLDEILTSRVEMVDVNAVLPRTGGLAAGAPVRIAGREVGSVVSVTLLPPGPAGTDRVVALARIPREHFDMLRSDSRARASKPGFVGDAVLEISPGSAGAALLTTADTIPPEFGPDQIAIAMDDARSLLEETDTLLVSLREVAASYEARRPMIAQVSRSVADARAELERTRVAYEGSALRGVFADAALRERFARVRESLATLQAGLGRYTSGPLRDRIDAVAARADSLQAELAVLDSAASSTDGFVGRMRADSALTVEAARTRAQMDSLVEDVMSNPFMFF